MGSVVVVRIGRSTIIEPGGGHIGVHPGHHPRGGGADAAPSRSTWSIIGRFSTSGTSTARPGDPPGAQCPEPVSEPRGEGGRSGCPV